MPRNCPSCGHENADDVDFCASCGGYLRWEPTRAATPAVAPPPPQTPPAPAAPAQPEQPAAPPPQQAQAPPPAQPAAPAPAQPQPAQPPPAPQQPAQVQPLPPEPEPEVEREPKKRRWGRKKAPKVPGVQGGGVQGPRVSGPRVSAPRVNVGPSGVRVSGPRVQAPRVQAPRAQAPRLKQPTVPTSPKGLLDKLKKTKVPGGGAAKGGGDSGAVGTGPVAPQPAETWHWDAVGQEGGGRGKVVAVFLALLLLAAGGAAAAWYFFVRDDGGTEPARAAATRLTPRQFVGRLEPLLVRSASDRARISTAVTAVAACTLDPGTAGAQVAQTVRGRRAVLRQVRRLRPPNAQTRRAAALLARSMSTSAAAGTSYGRWIAAANGACPKRTGPDYASALAANVQAQSAKAAFARTYNPIARRFGRRTYTAGQF